jgi:hypothetical protein
MVKDWMLVVARAEQIKASCTRRVSGWEWEEHEHDGRERNVFINYSLVDTSQGEGCIGSDVGS